MYIGNNQYDTDILLQFLNNSRGTLSTYRIKEGMYVLSGDKSALLFMRIKSTNSTLISSEVKSANISRITFNKCNYYIDSNGIHVENNKNDYLECCAWFKCPIIVDSNLERISATYYARHIEDSLELYMKNNTNNECLKYSNLAVSYSSCDVDLDSIVIAYS